MSNAEYDLLSPEPGNQMEVWCNTCDKSIAKRSIFKHLQDRHPELEAGSWGDYNLLKKNKVPDEHSPFNIAWTRKAARDPSSSLVADAWEAYQRDLSPCQCPPGKPVGDPVGPGMASALEEQQQQTDIHEEHPAIDPDGEQLDEESVAGESIASVTPTPQLP